MAEWSNWSGRQTSTPARIVTPQTEAEIVAAVRDAATNGLPVRAVGAAHSHSRIAATNGMVVDLDAWQGVVSSNSDSLSATIKSGTRIYRLGEPLRRINAAFLSLPRPSPATNPHR